VKTIVKLDQKKRISFAPLQGITAQQRNLGHYLTKDGGTMVLMRENDRKIFTRGEAGMELLRALGGAWKLLSVIRYIPAGFRDKIYCWFAKNRHRFIKKSKCQVPSAELISRSLP
jgi:predicted DCC family thiol-disulfide oxidoreductase YuxK